MTRYEDLDPEARSFLERLHGEIRAADREHQERRLEAGLPEPSGPPAIEPGTVVVASFVDVVERDGHLGVSVEEHSLIWPEAG